MKKMICICAGLVAMFTMLGGVMQAQEKAPGQAAEKHHKVVVAITSGDEADWNMTMGNTRHILDAWPQAEIEIVAYGPGLAIVVKPSSVDEAIQGLMAKGVKFVACENSMRARKVTKDGLVTGVGTVPSGVVEVLKKQEEGWSYIKAGH